MDGCEKRVLITLPGIEYHNLTGWIDSRHPVPAVAGIGRFIHFAARGGGMETTAASIMTTQFPTLFPETPLADAIRLFREASRQHGRPLFGVMVTDRNGNLAGMLAMYDILLFMRPKHIQIWGAMEDLDVVGLIDAAGNRIKSIQVGDIMTTEVITIGPNVNLFMVLDIMIKKHVRRLPVVEKQKIIGIVYISALFNHLLERIGD